jgi:diaminopimelate decarboxylase
MKRLDLFPLTTTIKNNKLMIANADLESLADQFGTPLYLYDRATLDHYAESYRRFLDQHYPAESSITYAGKAFLCKAICVWSQSHNLTIDCTGAGEIAIAVAAGIRRDHILVHGVNKSSADLIAAINHAGTIVVDNLSELKRIIAVRDQVSQIPNVWLRFQPGEAVKTHHTFTQTGHEDSKFGMSEKELAQALTICIEKNLPLNGIHFHQGSQFRDPLPLKAGIDRALDLAQEFQLRGEWHLSPGGGWGVAYHEDELPHPEIETYVRFVAEHVIDGCHSRGLTLPRLHLEPGRSIVARAGAAIYRVGTIKHTTHKTWLLIDGGMADNIRHALYGARYSALPIKNPDRSFDQIADIAGPFCESGDVIIAGLPFPAIDEGELIAVPVAGAYHLSMASNYNGARRPAALMIDQGKVNVMIERETIDRIVK